MLLFIAIFAAVVDCRHSSSDKEQMRDCHPSGLPQFYDRFCIKSTHGTYLRHINEVVGMSTECNRNGHWRLWRLIDGTVIMYPQDSPTRYLYTNRVGAVSIEHWRWIGRRWAPQKNDDGSWSFQTKDHSDDGLGWLSVDKNGSISVSKKDSASIAKFWLQPLSGSISDVTTSLSKSHSSVPKEKSKESECKIATLPGFFDEFCFKTVHGTYLRNLKDKQLDTSEHCEKKGQWRLWTLSDGDVAIRPPERDDYLGAKDDGSIDIVGWMTSGNQWLVRMNKHGSLSFRSEDGAWWLSVDKNGTFYGAKDDSDQASLFWIVSPEDAKPAESVSQEDSEETESQITQVDEISTVPVVTDDSTVSTEYTTPATPTPLTNLINMPNVNDTIVGDDSSPLPPTASVIAMLVLAILIICIAVYLLFRKREMNRKIKLQKERKLDVDYHVVEDELPQGVQ